MSSAEKGHDVKPSKWSMMEVRSVTDEDLQFWASVFGDRPQRVHMRGDHIGARNIEVVRSRTANEPPFVDCFRVPFIVPGGDGTTYWLTLFTDTFPAVAGIEVTP